MKEKNENKLDQLFRDGISGSEDHIAFREEDWESMEQLLDNKPGKKAGLLRIIYYASGIAALLLLAAGLYFYTNRKTVDPLITKTHKDNLKPKTKTDSLKTEEFAAANGTKASTSKMVDNGGTQSRNNNIVVPVSSAVNPGLAVNKGNKKDIVNNSEDFAAKKSQKNQSTPKDTTYNKVDNIAVSPSQKVKVNGKDTIYNKTTNMAINQLPKTQIAGADTIYNNKIASVNTQIKKESSPIQKDTIYDKAAVKEEQQRLAVKRDAIKNRPQFSISVLAASDANAVNSFGRSETGTNYGLQFSVRLTKKLTMTTGLAYAIKPYSANYSSYSSVSYSPAIAPTNIQANCKVLDIPLNVSYQLYSKGNNAIALGTGLSSYFMLKENYRFDYSAESGWKPYNLEVKNQNTHLFGVVNVNVNYQRRINSKFSAVIQPYMKLPITGIGNGNVNLKSTGVALGVNWTLGRR